MSAKPVDLRALEAAHQFTSVEHTQYTLISRGEFHALIAALRIAVEALRELADGPCSFGRPGNIVDNALAAIEKEVTL